MHGSIRPYAQSRRQSWECGRFPRVQVYCIGRLHWEWQRIPAGSSCSGGAFVCPSPALHWHGSYLTTALRSLQAISLIVGFFPCHVWVIARCFSHWENSFCFSSSPREISQHCFFSFLFCRSLKPTISIWQAKRYEQSNAFQCRCDFMSGYSSCKSI